MALIYIVEDDENIREIEEFALRNAGFAVESFPNAANFFAFLEEKLPDLVLLDIMLPDESGNDIVKNLRASEVTKSIPVIMVTAKTTELDLAKGLENGADDYIKKPFSIVELISRVKALLRRTGGDSQQVIRIDELVLDDGRHVVTLGGAAIDLTYKEYELLKYFLVNKDLVLDRAQIMDKIWGMDYEPESRTLDMHIKSLRCKLGDYGNRIITVRNVGYKFC